MKLNDAEQAFLDGLVDELGHMLDDWQIQWRWRDLPPEAYGGLGFSAYAHSEVIRKISTRSLTGAVTVMVPNSLGPGELLVQFGTEEQKARWLPRLAEGREIPCFCLTSPEAASDAASMTNSGIICYGEHNGERVLGMRLNWHKRYITLGPVASVLGLAFKLYDPDRLLGSQEDLGITVALVPTNTPAAFQAFQNGPNWGRDVFAPLDLVVGGRNGTGEGWKMLMKQRQHPAGAPSPRYNLPPRASCWGPGPFD